MTNTFSCLKQIFIISQFLESGVWAQFSLGPLQDCIQDVGQGWVLIWRLGWGRVCFQAPLDCWQNAFPGGG